MRKAVALVAIAGTTAARLGLAGASASPKSAHRQVLTMRLVATNGYFVDNDPSGPSGGDLFGSAADLRRHGHKIGPGLERLHPRSAGRRPVPGHAHQATWRSDTARRRCSVSGDHP